MSLADSLGIPSNLRRIYLPFTPKNNPGYFTYKRDVGVGNPDIITPFSKNVERLINLDSGVSFVHDQKMAKLQYNNFLKYIPSLQIREYVPDAKLTQCFKWIDALTQGIKDGMIAGKDVNLKEMFTMENIKDSVSQLTSNLGSKFMDLVSDSAKGLMNVVGSLGLANYRDMKFPVGKDAGYAVLYAPFLLYYRLNTTTTTNVYELPFDINTSNELMHSDGTYGWGGTDAFSSGRYGLGANSQFSKLLGLNTLKVNVMPSFDPDGNQQGKNFSITFNLINDTAEGTAENYIMLHNLFGNNRWLQYGFVQTSSALYDVKIPGANRYFMCKGQFTCNSVGGFRTPSNKVCNGIVGSMSNSKGGEKGKDFYDSVYAAKDDVVAQMEKNLEGRETIEQALQSMFGVDDITNLPADATEEVRRIAGEINQLDTALDAQKETVLGLSRDIEKHTNFFAYDLGIEIPSGTSVETALTEAAKFGEDVGPLTDEEAQAMFERKDSLTDAEMNQLKKYSWTKYAQLCGDQTAAMEKYTSDLTTYTERVAQLKEYQIDAGQDFNVQMARAAYAQYNETGSVDIREAYKGAANSSYDEGNAIIHDFKFDREGILTQGVGWNAASYGYSKQNDVSYAFTVDMPDGTRKEFSSPEAAANFVNGPDQAALRQSYPRLVCAVNEAYQLSRYDRATVGTDVEGWRQDVNGQMVAIPVTKPIKSAKDPNRVINLQENRNQKSALDQLIRLSPLLGTSATATASAANPSQERSIFKRDGDAPTSGDTSGDTSGGASGNTPAPAEPSVDDHINAIQARIDDALRVSKMKQDIDTTSNLLASEGKLASSLASSSGDLDSSGNIFVQREYFKIPDAYKVTLTFTSLLPDNFNNFLYGFRNDNLDPVFNYIKEGKTIDKSVFEQLFDQLRGYIGK